MSDNMSQKSADSAIKAGGTIIFKNVKAYWEQEIRQGLFLPAFTSKFINEKTITQVKNHEILCIRQEQVCFRVCMTPPSKLVLVNKLEQHLKKFNLKSGIDLERGNFPDKDWLILAIATLSQGKDEIFSPSYVPSRDIFGVPKQQEFAQQNMDMPAHLIGFGKGRHLKLGGLSKEEKVAQQIKASEARVQKQQEQQEKLKKELELHKSKDKAAVQKMQERDKLRQEVVAEYQASANNFVAEEIAKAKFQMEQEFERKLQEEALKQAMKYPMIPQFQPFVASGMNNGLQFPDASNRVNFAQSEEMELSLEPLTEPLQGPQE